jgi:hypothetical protein
MVNPECLLTVSSGNSGYVQFPDLWSVRMEQLNVTEKNKISRYCIKLPFSVKGMGSDSFKFPFSYCLYIGLSNHDLGRCKQ